MTGDVGGTVLSAIFWASLLTIAFAYIGYPALIALAARAWGVRPRAALLRDRDLPTVSLLIAAHNEEDVIAARLENALALDYPRDRLEIVVASDGSADGTDDQVRTFAARGVRLDSLAERRGKAATLNRVIPTLKSDVIVLSDANTFTEPDALRRLVRWFVDPTVGVVCGKLILVDHAAGHNVDGLYWRIETAIKAREAQLGALLGANGAIYALRPSVFSPIPDNTIVDDLVLPLKARLTTGCRVLFDETARAVEETAPSVRLEFARRARIGAGGFQAICLLWRLLDPRRGWIALTFFAHKLLRWLCPFLLVALLVASLPLALHPFYGPVLLAQVAFHVVARVSFQPNVWARLPRALRFAVMFDAMNLALLVGFWRWLHGTPSAGWSRTERTLPFAPASIGPTPPPVGDSHSR